MKNVLFILFLFFAAAGAAQKRNGKSFSFYITNNHTAYPFASFSKLIIGQLHPGFEAGYEFNWKSKGRHDWFQTFKAGYFYHRFVQHGVPLYTQFGYRYKFGDRFRASSSLGGGYMHSLPATAVLKTDEQGDYSNGKGFGRGQLIANFTVGGHYHLQRLNARDVTLSLQYQQRLQMPFVKSYVPLLPYNSMQIGFSIPLNK